MKKPLLLSFALALVFLPGCMSQKSQIENALKENPKILFDVIEENPQLFIESVNRAARKAQELSQKDQREALQKSQEVQLKNPLKPKLSKSTLLHGELSAPVVIVEYADFKCPACKMAKGPLEKVKAELNGQVQIHYKHFPLDFHPMALPAARYFEALKLEDHAIAKKFFSLVFDRQRELQSEAVLKSLAKKAGSNPEKLKNNLNSPEVDRTIAEHMEEFQIFGFTGTPVILVNGVALQGAQPFEAIMALVEKTKTH